MKIYLRSIGITIFLCVFSAMIFAQTTEFTYQGRLADSAGTAASYDFEFKLFAAPSGGLVPPLGTQTRLGVPVSGGVFTVQLDFGAHFDGAPRYLEIAVKPAGSSGSYIILTPRQPITSAPYAVRSLNAGVAINSTQLGGTAANQFVQTGDTRLSDDRNPLPNSANYIQNTNSPQTSSNFNISGTGTANILSAATQFNIGNSRILSSPVNTDNLFVGRSAGQNNTNFGIGNTFVGGGSGRANTDGSFNTFVGASTGLSNTAAEYNTFIGASAGRFNTTGTSNTFVGTSAGQANTSGKFNSFVGRDAGLMNTDGEKNTFFGFESGFSNIDTDGNSFFGYRSGKANTGSNNAFFGTEAGITNSTGSENSFFGRQTGNFNTTGANNSFFGSGAGYENTIGSNNAFVGYNAGTKNTEGEFNAFFGRGAGIRNTIGSQNTFVGGNSGSNTTIGESNTFVGTGSGSSNNSGSENVFVGVSAGSLNTGGSNNTIIGKSANVTNGNLNFAAAIGAGATVSTSNTIVLGRSNGLDKVRIFGLGTAGATPLCRNANNEISTCLPPLAESGNAELLDTVKNRQTQIEEQQKQLQKQQEQIARQQKQIEVLTKLFCQINPNADICKE